MKSLLLSAGGGGAFLGLVWLLLLGPAAQAWVVVPAAGSSRRSRRGPAVSSSTATLSLRRRTPSLFQSSSSAENSKTEESATTAAATDPAPNQSTDVSSDDDDDKVYAQLNAQQHDFIIGYLNKHHAQLLQEFAATFSDLGKEMANANTMSGGSFAIQQTRLVDLQYHRNEASELVLEVTVQRRGRDEEQRTVTVPLDAEPVVRRRSSKAAALAVPQAHLRPRRAVDEIVRRLMRLCWIVGQPAATGQLIQLALQLDGAGVGQLPENL